MKLPFRLLLAALILGLDFVVYFLPLTALFAAYVIVLRPEWFFNAMLVLYPEQDLEKKPD